ncbi:alkaline phosphatase family protein [Thalassotalea sp. HSM 43]|uniref:alkaline phosphatase family protein n=1 Tax=Thalassotalea sp. HSM 43 TaxID=2552945 RepID=UPI001080DCAB|nr:alkaline phosphatase family protein [Thalassotalea sp. HSM 43]QBY03084.1 alkaline phosphatase family protein [Thalassotalea sp. HSM 43]
MLKNVYKNTRRFNYPITLSFMLMGICGAVQAEQQPPKLVLQITVDQLRADLPYRYQDRFVKNGFNYLFDNGVVYKDAHHPHANTETIVGHVTLATGATPATHGLIANMWFDRKAQRQVYNIEDDNYVLLSKGASVDKDTEIDPTQKAANVEGRSPTNIIGSTFADELSISTNGKAKVFGVSVKDRGAVSLAGHSGKAFWFSKQAGEFVTSNYYYQAYPSWVEDWNDKGYIKQFAGTQWQLLNKKDTYLFGNDDDKAWEMDMAGYGRTFPHAFGSASSKYFTTLLTVSPVGDEMTVDFAKALVKAEDIGDDDITDYLAISLSATDYIGHFFGASSLESEDNILRLDRTLADLFEFIDEHVGLANTVIVLSADHGGPEVPGYLNEKNIYGEYVPRTDWEQSDEVKAVKKLLRINERLVEAFSPPYIYLDMDTIAKTDFPPAMVQDLLVAELNKREEIFTAIASHKLESGNFPDTPVYQAVFNNHSQGRSGDIYLVFKPHDFINDLEGLTVTATHGSPWNYDTHVPIIFVGKDIAAKNVNRRVETIDLAPTLSALLNIKAPSASEGKVLVEVVDR